MDTRKVSQMGLLIALALVLSFIEAQIPAFVAIPGIKIGLANIVVVFALYRLGTKEAVTISFLRVLLASLMFGSVLSLAYSFAGAFLSLLGMVLLKKTRLFGSVAVSVVGGVLHNIGQILTACIVLDTNVIVYYLPFLILSGTIAGVVIGLLSSLILNRLDYAREKDSHCDGKRREEDLNKGNFKEK